MKHISTKTRKNKGKRDKKRWRKTYNIKTNTGKSKSRKIDRKTKNITSKL